MDSCLQSFEFDRQGFDNVHVHNAASTFATSGQNVETIQPAPRISGRNNLPPPPYHPVLFSIFPLSCLCTILLWPKAIFPGSLLASLLAIPFSTPLWGPATVGGRY